MPQHIMQGCPIIKRKNRKKDFDRGKISVVVTTAALAAGVDFPASQVIFDSLVMGNKWISPNDFHKCLDVQEDQAIMIGNSIFAA